MITDLGPTTVSILLPAYNARAIVERAIDSVLAQTHRDWELIVVDDASSDGTAEAIMARYAGEPRVRVLKAPSNGGPARARNQALQDARGQWVALIDADDAWRPERLERLLARGGHDADLVFDNLCGYDAHARVETGPVFEALPDAGFGVDDLIAPLVQNSELDFGYLKPLIRRSLLSEHGIAYDDVLRTSEDVLLYLELLIVGARVSATSEAMYIYTTPRGGKSGVFSNHSHSVPNDAALIAGLERMLERRQVGPQHPAWGAIAGRIAYLRRVGPIASFYYARRKRDLAGMVRLAATNASVRGEIGRKAEEVLGRRLRKLVPGRIGRRT